MVTHPRKLGLSMGGQIIFLWPWSHLAKVGPFLLGLGASMARAERGMSGHRASRLSMTVSRWEHGSVWATALGGTETAPWAVASWCERACALRVGRCRLQCSAIVEAAVMNQPHAPTALVNTTHCQNGVSTGYRAHLQTEAACSFQLFQHFSKHFGALVAPLLPGAWLFAGG